MPSSGVGSGTAERQTMRVALPVIIEGGKKRLPIGATRQKVRPPSISTKVAVVSQQHGEGSETF